MAQDPGVKVIPIGVDGEEGIRLKGSNAIITAVAVTAVAQSLSALLIAAGAGVKTERVAIEVQNLGSGIVYVGAAGVTTANGRKISSVVGDGAWSIPLDAASDVYIIGSAPATAIVTQV